MTEKEIAKYLVVNLEYDCGDDNKCPHCGKPTTIPTYWYYHYESLSHNLASEMGLSDVVGDIIVQLIGDEIATGNKKKDAKKLAGMIYATIYK